MSDILAKRQLCVFILGTVIGIAIDEMIRYAMGIIWQSAKPDDYFYGILSYGTGYMGLYLFILLSMIISLMLSLSPYLESRFPNSKQIPKIKLDGLVVPFVRGVTFGFGIMILYHVFAQGPPKLFGTG